MNQCPLFRAAALLACVLALGAALSVPAWAGPAAPDPVVMTQPDGSTFQGRIKGDEFRNWVESEDGYNLVQGADGYWEYALDGMVPSGVRAGQAPPARALRRSKPSSYNMELRQGLDRLIRGTWNPVGVSGTKRLLVVLVGFANKTSTIPASDWSTTIFSATGGVKSVRNFYTDNSFSTMTVTPVTHNQAGSPAGIVNCTLALNHPNSGRRATDYAGEKTWVQAALRAVNSTVSGVDFDALDTDGDGTIETNEALIYLIPAGYEASGSVKTPNVWAHALSGLTVKAGTKNLSVWAINGELNNSDVQHPMGVIAHELGHQMCALPDLYDTSDTNQGLGQFSLMASGSWGRDAGESGGITPVNLDAWSRQYLGWSAPRTPSASASLSFGAALSSANAPVKLANSAVSSTEYFLVENRQATGWDLGLAGLLSASGYTGGLLVQHVDISIGTPGANDINRYGTGAHQGVVPVQASTASCDMLAVSSTCRGHQTTLFYSGNNAALTATSSPSATFYSGTALGRSLTSISSRGATMSATLNVDGGGDSSTVPALDPWGLAGLAAGLALAGVFLLKRSG